MNMQSIRRLYLIVIVLCVTALLGLSHRPPAMASSPQAISLIAPALASVNNQGAVAEAIGQKLDTEAGISAYFKSPDPIALSQVRPMFRTIETETTDYILGSIGIPNYAEEHFDAHVYVHKSGWILAYYLRNDPISKIIDTRAFSTNTTKLNNVVAAVASTAGAPFTNAIHYDFRYPNATNMMLIAEDPTNGDEFTIKMPASYGYFERGWASQYNAGLASYLKLNGAVLTSQYDSRGIQYGTITSAAMLPDTTHTIQLFQTFYGVLIVIYRVP